MSPDTERIEIVHTSGATSTVTREAFERRSSKLGWKLACYVPVTDEMLQDRAIGPELPAFEDEAERRELRRWLQAHGVAVDGRWGLKRLRSEKAKVKAKVEASVEAAE